MKTLVWHWGRRGAGPVFAARLAEAIAELPGQTSALSLAEDAELRQQPDAPICDWVEPTYRTAFGYTVQRMAAPFLRGRTVRRLAALQPDAAICAMPALLDQRMAQALLRQNIPYAVIVHDATAHPGEAFSFLAVRQSKLLLDANILFPLSSHVEAALRRQGFGTGGQIIKKLWHPPFAFGNAPPVFAHGGLPRLLFFGRLLPYKGLDLLAAALEILGPDLPFDVRICGAGPASVELARLQKMQNVSVDRRWNPESELPALLGWADGLVLPYREASQSGAAAAAIALGRYVLATNVGGLPEQLSGIAHATICAPAAEAIAEGLKIMFAPPPAQQADTGADWRAMAEAAVASLRPAIPGR